MRQTFPLIMGFVIGASAPKAMAAYPPEIPAERTTQVFSPFYFNIPEGGESAFVLNNQGLRQRGYIAEAIYLEITEPVVGQTSRNASFDRFVSLLSENASGIFFMSSHGGLSGWLGVESYPASDAGRVEAQIKAAEYRQRLGLPPDDIQHVMWGQVTSGHHDVIVSNLLVKDLQSMPHSIVLINACYSDTMSTGFLANHRVRNFIGINNLLVPDEPAYEGKIVSETFFNTLTGMQALGGIYSNHSVAAAADAANEAVPALVVRIPDGAVAGEPDPALERLYTAPRMVMADLRQDIDGNQSYSRQLYSFVFGDDIYPYDRKEVKRIDYPSGGVVQKQVASAGPLEIKLRFSEPMQTNFSEFHVDLWLPEATTAITFSPQDGNNGWTSVHMPHPSLYDTWTGRATIPSDARDGTAQIRIRARHLPASPEQASGTQELDTSGTGISPTEAWDTQVSSPMADPYFLVDNEKLIFYGLAQKTRENWGSRSFTIGV
jgi:hypothetical protein